MPTKTQELRWSSISAKYSLAACANDVCASENTGTAVGMAGHVPATVRSRTTGRDVFYSIVLLRGTSQDFLTWSDIFDRGRERDDFLPKPSCFGNIAAPKQPI